MVVVVVVEQRHVVRTIRVGAIYTGALAVLTFFPCFDGPFYHGIRHDIGTVHIMWLYPDAQDDCRFQ
jgi:hypothetical protein